MFYFKFQVEDDTTKRLHVFKIQFNAETQSEKTEA